MNTALSSLLVLCTAATAASGQDSPNPGIGEFIQSFDGRSSEQQDPKDGAAKARELLQQAQLVSESEGDSSQAIELLRRALELSPEGALGTEAWLTLGLELRRVGKEQEALSALGRAAAGQGDAAGKAQAALTAAQNDEVAARVREQIEIMERSPGYVSDDLVWMGEIAVPEVTSYLASEPSNARMLTQVAQCLMQVDSDLVRAWCRDEVSRYPAWRQRAVIRATENLQSRAPFANRRALNHLLEAEDKGVRLEALEILAPAFSAAEWAAALRDPETSDIALQYTNNGTRGISASSAEQVEDLRIALESKLESLGWRTSSVKSAAQLMSAAEKVGGEAERSFFRWNVARMRAGDTSSGYWTGVTYGLGDALVDEALAAARELGDRDYLHSVLVELSRSWTLAAHDRALEMELLVPRSMAEYLTRVWSIEVPASALEVAARFAYGRGQHPPKVIPFLDPKDLNDEQMSGLVRGIQAALRTGEEGWADEASKVLLATGREAAAGALIEACGLSARLRSTILKGAQSRTDALSSTVLRALLQYPGQVSWSALASLAQRGDLAMGSVLAELYQRGEVSGDGGPLNSLGNIWENRARGGCGYSAGQLAEVVRPCLLTGSARAWEGVTDTSWDWPAEVHRLMVELVESAPIEAADRTVGFAIGEWIEEDVLRRLWSDKKVPNALERLVARSPGDFTLIREGLSPSNEVWVLQKAVSLAQRAADENLFDAVAALAGHKNAGLRAQLLPALHACDADRATPLVVAALSDSRRDVVDAAIRVALESADSRYFPHLVELLRSPDNRIRETAEIALGKLRNYLEEKQRWERLQATTGLDSTDAAAALIRKAASADTDESIRVAAIRSLGTLAVPETLPVLLDLMADESAAIREAAAAAVAKINGK